MSWLSRLSNVFRSERLDHALDEEMRFHLESRTEALIAGGVPAEQAALEARRSLGNQLTYREASHDIRLLAGLESIIRDLRYGVRSLRRAPGFTVVASLTLALRDLAALFGASLALHLLGDYPESLDMLDRLTSSGQARWSAVLEGLHDHYRGQSAYFKARSFYRLQQPEEARKWVDLAREKQLASDEIRYLSAVLYKDDSRTEEARLELEEVVRHGTVICEAYHLLGLVSLQEGRAFTDCFLSAGYCLERSLRNMEEKLEEFSRLALPSELKALGLEQRREQLEIARIEAHELLAEMLSILDSRRETGGRISADALLEVIERLWKWEDD